MTYISRMASYSEILNASASVVGAGSASNLFLNTEWNGTVQNGWVAPSNSIPSTIKWNYTDSVTLSSLGILSCYLSGCEAVKDFELYGSITGVFSGEQEILLIGQHINDTTQSIIYYNIPTPKSFKYYMLKIISLHPGNGGNDAFLSRISQKILTEIEEVTTIDDLSIGKGIRCHYKASSNQVGVFSDLGKATGDLIPANSSAAPDGSFYFIHAGYDYQDRAILIADRNIQHSISWDVLNNAGIINGLPYKFVSNIPNLSSANDKGYIVTQSSMYGGDTGYAGWRAFDKKITSSSVDRWISSSKVCWLNLQMPDAARFTNYSIVSIFGAASPSQAPKDWKVQGSMDGVIWDDLDVRANEIGWATNEKRIFSIQNPGMYLHYRISITDTNGANYTSIGELDFFKDVESLSAFGFEIRLLTGGISATDKDNEWDKIICESDLNDTITPGNNDVWNWSTNTLSWTSTVGSVNTQRVVRGFTNLVANWGSAPSNETQSSGGNPRGFRPVLIVEKLAKPSIFEGQLLPDTVHYENIRLVGSIIDDNQVGYKIFVNGNQIYPANGYTSLSNSPVGVDCLISNDILSVELNEIIIETINTDEIITKFKLFATLYNTAPNGVLTLSNNIIHSENIDITGALSDNELDLISCRVLVNDIELLGWTNFIEDPIIDYRILNSEFSVGDNNLIVEFKDNFKESRLGIWQQIITKTNENPVIDMQISNGLLTAEINDSEFDMINYRIFINNKQTYPANGYSSNFSTPFNFKYAINRNDVIIGQNNILILEVKDNLGGTTTQEIQFVGEYVGLMFIDENREFYTTDVGELLKYLDFGTITLGQITEPKKVFIQNKFGFPISNIELTVQNTLSNIAVEISKTNYPFIAEQQVLYANNYNPNDEECFYIRLSTTLSLQSVSGTFKITAKAQQV